MGRFFVVILLLAPVTLHAASFDCSKASTPVEKTICSSPDLSAADEKLDQAYRAALTKVPEAAMLVRESERTWLQSVGQTCRHPVDTNFADCLAEKWEDRTFFLSNIAVRMGGVPFFFRELSLDKPCNEEDLATGLAKTSPQTRNPKNVDSDHYSCAIHAAWPEAISNAPEWQAWNKALLDEARRFNASQDREDKVPDRWVRFADPLGYNDLQISVDLDLVSSPLIAATINRDYTNSHPTHEERTFNWLLKQDRELKPDDLFRPDSIWQSWMKKRTAQIVKDYEITELESDPSEAEDIATEAAEIAIEPRNWRIEHKGITLSFTEDELGSYITASMMPDVTFSWSDLQPYLNPTFEIPR
jgi:uncharacterized protein YecT (DUF1311 family)